MPLRGSAPGGRTRGLGPPEPARGSGGATGVGFSSKQLAVALLCTQACVCASVRVATLPRLAHFNAAFSPDENIHILIMEKKNVQSINLHL